MTSDPEKPSSKYMTGGDRTSRSRGGRAVSRRGFLKMAGAVAAGGALSACTPAQQPPAQSKGTKVQLVYSDWRTDWFPPMARQMLEEFHASHPNIRVFYTPDPEALEERMLTSMQSGTAPDVFAGCCHFLPIWAQRGFTLDLRPYVKADLDQGTIDEWDSAQYGAFFTRDGKQYALPKYHGALALYYNKELFDQHGVSYPDDSWDHEDYLEAMKRLTFRKPTLGPGSVWGSMLDISWDRIQMHVNGWGGHLVDPADPARSLMAEPEAMKAMEWLRSAMWDDRVMATPLDVEKLNTRQAFVAGKLGMVEEGSWALREILAGADFRVGIAPFPAGPIRKVTLATTDGFGIYSGTKHPEAAWELMKFLISKEYGRAMARTNFLQPARASLVDEWASYIRQELGDRARDVDIAAFADGHLKGYSVTAEIFANMADARTLAYTAWDRIFALGQSPVDLMRETSRKIGEVQRADSGGRS